MIQQHLGVRYLYAESVPQDTSNRLDSSSPGTPTLELAGLATDWVNRLYQGALVANSQALYTLLDELPPDRQPLALALRRWVKDFRCDKIVELVEQGRDATRRESDHFDCG